MIVFFCFVTIEMEIVCLSFAACLKNMVLNFSEFNALVLWIYFRALFF